MHALIHLGVLTATVLALARFQPGFRIKSPAHALLAAVVFSLLNFTVGWLISAVLFVPALLTLGLLFLVIPFIVNTVILWATDKVLVSFEIDGFDTLLTSAAVITVANGVLHFVLR